MCTCTIVHTCNLSISLYVFVFNDPLLLLPQPYEHYLPVTWMNFVFFISLNINLVAGFRSNTLHTFHMHCFTHRKLWKAIYCWAWWRIGRVDDFHKRVVGSNLALAAM